MEEVLSQILTELKQVNGRLGSVENRLDSMENRLDSMENRLDSMEQRLSSIETEQQQIKQAVFETNEHVKRLETIQDGQQRIIDLLSVRSIQHEAELKRLQ